MKEKNTIIFASYMEAMDYKNNLKFFGWEVVSIQRTRDWKIKIKFKKNKNYENKRF